MNTLTCIIVDDEPLAVKMLESFVAKTPDLELKASFTDSVEALSAIKADTPDIIFLDIQMPDIDGMEFARMVPQSSRIIFTTAFKEYAFESYEVNALDFLLKPVRYTKFLTAVDKARQWYSRNGEEETKSEKTASPETLFIKVDGELRQVSLSRILYVCGMKDYVMFYLEDERKPLITHMTMKSVEELLPTTSFMRVHRSYIVALEKIRKVDRNDCVYIGDEIIHVTDAFREKFDSYLKSKIPENR